MSPRRDFGATWWGQEWVRALDGRAQLDPNRLPRGRTYARQSRVIELGIEPGEVTARVQGRRRVPYVIRLRVRQFTDAEWTRVVGAIAAKAGHAAALLDGELLSEIVDDAESVGVGLLPGPGELGPSCSCPDWADPCKHSAAVCYLVADALDDDPFALFLMRGRTREWLLAEIRARRQAAAPIADVSGARVESWGASRRRSAGAEGVVAREAYARAQPTADALWALDIAVPPDRPGSPAALTVPPPTSSGVRADDLRRLASDAADRAWSLAVGVSDGGLDISAEEDLARWAARCIGTSDMVDLAARARVTLRLLMRLAVAWQHGEREGVEVSEQTWDPPDDLVDEGRRALSRFGKRVTVRHNHLRVADVQLRLGRSGLWYRFEKVGTQWELEGPPAPDPFVLLSD